MGHGDIDGVPAVARWRELYERMRGRPACGPTGLVCSCYCVRSATVVDGGG